MFFQVVPASKKRGPNHQNLLFIPALRGLKMLDKLLFDWAKRNVEFNAPRTVFSDA
jgi:hypothetical protein